MKNTTFNSTVKNLRSYINDLFIYLSEDIFKNIFEDRSLYNDEIRHSIENVTTRVLEYIDTYENDAFDVKALEVMGQKPLSWYVKTGLNDLVRINKDSNKDGIIDYVLETVLELEQ